MDHAEPSISDEEVTSSPQSDAVVNPKLESPSISTKDPLTPSPEAARLMRMGEQYHARNVRKAAKGFECVLKRTPSPEELESINTMNMDQLGLMRDLLKKLSKRERPSSDPAEEPPTKTAKVEPPPTTSILSNMTTVPEVERTLTNHTPYLRSILQHSANKRALDAPMPVSSTSEYETSHRAVEELRKAVDAPELSYDTLRLVLLRAAQGKA